MEQLPRMFKGKRSAAKVNALGARTEDFEDIKEQIGRILANPPKRSGAGPTGMRYEHLKPLAENAEGMAVLTRLCIDFLQGRLPTGMQQCIAATRIVAFLKPSQKIRPLGLGLVIRRIATTALVRVFTPRVAAIVGNLRRREDARNGSGGPA